MPLARQRRGLSFLDNLVVIDSAHDVTAACCLARAEERVRFPLGALAIGVWESLAIPPAPEAGDRWFKSNCADSIAEGQLLVVARVC